MASLAINGGIPASVVQRIGNWKTRSMLDRCAHLSDTTMREAGGTVAQLVARGHKVVTKAKRPVPPRLAQVLDLIECRRQDSNLHSLAGRGF